MSQTKELNNNHNISFFERYLTVWVFLCMIAGVLINRFIPELPAFLQKFEVQGQNIPIAILIWIMIFPMMIKIDFEAIKNVGRHPLGIIISTGTSWLIKPFLMFGLATLFLKVIFSAILPPELAQQYVTGAVLLGAAPCTAMVFVWSYLADGDPAHTLVQVSVNDILIMFLFVPIVSFLLGVNNVAIPWGTLIFSVILFVAIPLIGGMITRNLILKNKGEDYLNREFLPKFDGITTIGLLLTLVIIFSFQGNMLIETPLYVLLIVIPLVLQNLITSVFAYAVCYAAKQPYEVAAPAALIGASDFFELSVAVAISMFGADSPVVLACTVGVLTEVPVMLLLVHLIRKTRKYFSAVSEVKH